MFLTTRLLAASKELEGLELESEALIERRKEVVGRLVDEAVFEAPIDSSHECFLSYRRLLEVAIENILVCRHGLSSLA